MTDQEINEAVARKLLGNSHASYLKEGIVVGDIPEYSRSIGAAWEIVEKVPCYDPEDRPCYFKLIKTMDGFAAMWRDPTVKEFWGFRAEADTAPKAICSAFLKLP